MSKALRKELTSIAVIFAILIVVSLIPAKSFLKFILYLIPYFLAGFDIFRELVEKLQKKDFFSEDFLMTLATVCAVIIGEYFEAVTVLLLFRLGEAFEEFAEHKSRRSVKELLDLRPDKARVIIDGQEKIVSPENVSVGMILLVQPGETIPLDAEVIDGRSSLDTSALTGESIPTDVGAGDLVLGGTVNLSGVIRLRVTKPWRESTVAKILKAVENSADGKTDTEKFITRFSRIYTPCVIVIAILIFIIGLIINISNWQGALYKALIFLVISCPCALAVSVPLAFFSGIGKAAKSGILIKGSYFIDRLSRASTVVFDKTGTLTYGSFSVKAVHPEKISDEHLLELAALAESYSNHPIAVSIQNASKGTLDEKLLDRAEEVAGLGVIASIAGNVIAVGNEELMTKLGAEISDCPHADATVVHVALGNTYAGHIVIADSIKENADKALYRLKSGGVKSIIMLTGDKMGAAARVADMLPAIDEFHPSLLPHDKAEIVEELISNSDDGSLIFVGDGINDAPVLAISDVGIAMGGIGSDAAIQAADVVVMDDSLEKIPLAIKISDDTMLVAKENIIGSLAIKAIVMILGLIGIANLPLAVFADVGVTVLAILNSMRLLFGKQK